MIVFDIMSGIAALAVGLIIAELVRKGRPRRHVDPRAVDIGESRSGGSVWRAGDYIPPPDDGRPRK